MTTRYKSTGRAELREIGDAILLPKKGAIENMDNKVLILNDVAAYLWKRLTERMTREDIIADALTCFKVQEEELSKDLAYFVETVVHLGLLAESRSSILSKPRQSLSGESGIRQYRHPKLYLYDLETDEETAFGPHVRGRSYVHRAVTRAWHGGCC
jgi:hypothetical protein